MKRLLMAGFLVICSATMLAVNKKEVKKDCSRNICCVKKCCKEQKTNPKTDYIFWEPVSRLLVVPQ